ncbi:MAG: oligopeptide/dipeptide ABC transporter ATP-binding protein, partial [Acetobacteraceae bacterium]
LIADEPTTALDATTQAEILALLSDLRRRLGMALLLISHDLGLLRWHTERVVIMYAGHSVESGKTAEVLTHPAHPYTSGLVQAARLARRPDGHFSMIGGDVPELEQAARLCPFLPRCEAALPRCRMAMPPMLSAGAAGHDARCWRLECEERAVP